MNPHTKETRFVHYPEEKYYNTSGWFDTGIWVEAGGFALVICTISINTGWHANVGLRLVDENNEPLLPCRTSNNTRIAAHFSMELDKSSAENLNPVSFHTVVSCKYVKLQIRSDDGVSYHRGITRINYIGSSLIGGPSPNHSWSHKPICTMSAIPLLPNYQGGANTIFTYQQPRMPRSSDDDKSPVYHSDKPKPSSSSKVPPR